MKMVAAYSLEVYENKTKQKKDDIQILSGVNFLILLVHERRIVHACG